MDHSARIRWFAKEIVPHEPDVRRWLASRMRGISGTEVEEVIQESYARIWTMSLASIRNPRAYLFVTARHIVGEVIRRSKIVSIELASDRDILNIASDEVSVENQISGRQEVARLNRIIEAMPPKCRIAFVLKKFDGLSQKEIAARMEIAESTVEKHLSKAMRIVLREMNVGDEYEEKEPDQNGQARYKF